MPDMLARTAVRSASISSPDWYRSSGRLAMARATIDAHASGTRLLSSRGSGMGPWQCPYMICTMLPAFEYGFDPVSRVKYVAPSE